MNEIPLAPSLPELAAPLVSPADDPDGRFAALLLDWQRSLSPLTRAAYWSDLRHFAAFAHLPEDPARALRFFVASGPAEANLSALRWRSAMAEAGLKPATINRRLASLRAALALLRLAGSVGWELQVKGLPCLKYRDTAGPRIEGVKAILRNLDGDGEKARRDSALVHLLFTMGLRRGEVVSLDVEHVDFEASRLWVRGKARGGEREALTMPERTAAAVRRYLDARGNPSTGPVFVARDRAKKGTGRLTGDGLFRLVRVLGTRAGVERLRPHGLRHAAITAALDAGRDVREVLRFSRHRDPRTLLHYDDNREDLGGKVAATVAAML